MQVAAKKKRSECIGAAHFSRPTRSARAWRVTRFKGYGSQNITIAHNSPIMVANYHSQIESQICEKVSECRAGPNIYETFVSAEKLA